MVDGSLNLMTIQSEPSLNSTELDIIIIKEEIKINTSELYNSTVNVNYSPYTSEIQEKFINNYSAIVMRSERKKQFSYGAIFAESVQNKTKMTNPIIHSVFLMRKSRSVRSAIRPPRDFRGSEILWIMSIRLPGNNRHATGKTSDMRVTYLLDVDDCKIT